jgi:copper chaperone NosL
MQPATLNKEMGVGVVSNRRQPKAAPVSLSLPKTGTLRSGSRWIVAVLSLSMLSAYFFPLWNIWLDAPQYPEGLNMQIWINKLTGSLDIINDLNHYIGMKPIRAESFAELTYMPYIVAGLIALGLISSLSNRKYMLTVFVVGFIALGVLGAIDFYNWEYHYGHDLNPHAAIKVPGMSYQPPMFGAKQLLNFTATAWPALGGIIVIIAGAGSLMVCLFELTRRN